MLQSFSDTLFTLLESGFGALPHGTILAVLLFYGVATGIYYGLGSLVSLNGLVSL